MSHALTESQAATWRLHPQRVRGYLTVWEPELVCKFVCDLPTVSYPCRQLGIDSVLEGDVEDVEVGMLFRIFDATGATLKGTGRAKQISGDTLIIHPVGQGDIDFTDGDVVEVYDFYLPYALLPYISPDGTLYKDYTLAFDDQTGEHFPPVANATVDRHADLVDSSGVITVTFDASTSFAMTDGGSISSYAWDFKDGTVVSGSTSTPQATVSFPAGRRWVSLVVTDDASNASNPKRIPIFAANPDTHRPHRARLARLGYSLQAGWEASFDLLDADTSGIPDHALVIFWLDRYYGGLRGDLTGCSTQFIGWTTSELIGLEPLWWSTHTLNVQGPIAILAGRPAFPQTVRSDVTPETWAEVKTLNWWKTVIYLLMWHSNILDLCNLVRPEWYNLYPVPRLDTEAGTLYDQVVFLAHAIFGEFTADHLGTLQLPRNPHLMLAAERGAMAPIAELTAADLAASSDGQGPQFEYSDWDTLAWLKAYAILADAGTSVPVQAIAPGTLPAQGTQVETANRLLALTQAEFNERIGNLYAYKQGRRDGRRVMRRGTLRLQHAGCVTDPAWLEPVTLTLDGDRNKRGYAFDGSRLVPTGMEMIFDHERGVIEEQLTVEEETSGSPGVTVLQADNRLPPFSGDTYPETISTNISGMDAYYLFKGTKIIAAFSTDGYLYTTADFSTPSSAGGPTWARYNLGVNGTPIQFVADAFSPGYMGSGDEINGWLITTTRIYYITDIFGTPVATSKHTFRAATTYDATHPNGNRSADASFGIQNHLVVCTYYATEGVWATYTTDNSAFTEVQITNQRHTDATAEKSIAPGCYVSSKTAGKVFTTAVKTSGNPPVCAGYVSTTYGATWAETNGTNGPVMNPGRGLACDLHFPWQGNPSELIAIHGASAAAGRELIKATGASSVDISPVTAGSGEPPVVHRVDMVDLYGAYAVVQTGAWSGDPDTVLESLGASFVSGTATGSCCGVRVYFNGTVYIQNLHSYWQQVSGPGNTYIITLYDIDDNVLAEWGGSWGDWPKTNTAVNVSGVASIWYRHCYGDPADPTVFKFGGLYFDGYVESSATVPYGPWWSRWQISPSIKNANVLSMIGANAALTASGLWISPDGGTTWTAIITPSGMSDYERLAIAGDDSNVIYCWGADGALAYSQDLGATWDERNGNMSLFTSPAVGTLIGICGGG